MNFNKNLIIIKKEKDKTIIKDNVTIKNSVHVLKCKNILLNIPIKINNIYVEKTHNTTIIVDSVVSYIKFVNCANVNCFVLDKINTMQIDFCKNICITYYNEENTNYSYIVTSDSQKIKINLPNGSTYYVKSSINDGKHKQYVTYLNKYLNHNIKTIDTNTLRDIKGYIVF